MPRQSTKLSFEQCSSLNSLTTKNQGDIFGQENSDQIFHPKKVGGIMHNDGSKRQKKTQRKQGGFKISLWKLEQNIAYMNFLRQHQEVMEGNERLRRIMKINQKMSKAVKSRTADQCGSHHQKMMKHHCDIPSIIEYIETLMEANYSCSTITDLEALPIFQEPQSVELVEIVDIINFQRSFSFKFREEFNINAHFNFQWQNYRIDDDLFN